MHIRYSPARLVAALLLPAALAAVALPVRAADGPIMLERKATRGDKVRVQSVMKGAVSGAEFEVTTITETEVDEVKPNGDTAFKVTEVESRLLVMGGEQPTQKAEPVLQVRDRRGRLLELTIQPNTVFAAGVDRLLVELTEPLLPDRPVAVNDSWETERPNPLVQGRTFKVRTTLAAVEKEGARTLWKLRQEAEVDTADAGLVKSEATFWLDAATGAEVKTEAKYSGVPSQFGAMEWTETREPVKK